MCKLSVGGVCQLQGHKPEQLGARQREELQVNLLPPASNLRSFHDDNNERRQSTTRVLRRATLHEDTISDLRSRFQPLSTQTHILGTCLVWCWTATTY